MFYLMNKDCIVAMFEITDTYFGEDVSIVNVTDKLPIGCTEDNLKSWIIARNAAKHRIRLMDYLKSMGANNLRGFINLTHGVSINDTYWFKEISDLVTWSDVSPYSNNFDKTIQRLAFGCEGAQELQLPAISPEFTTEGSYVKCWTREGSDIYLYKRSGIFGIDAYGEYLASQVFDLMSAGISYELVQFHGQIASRCKLFSDESIGFVPYYKVKQDCALVSMFKFYESLGSVDKFRRMLVCDAITFNTDRHAGNHGCLFDTDSLELLSISPSFDFNLSLFPFESIDAFANLNDLTGRYYPKIGDSFVDVARKCLTSEIRTDLINLKGFKYEFEGDDVFSKSRVDLLSDVSNQQINLILGTQQISYNNPKVDGLSNIYKYRLKYKMSEEDFIKDVPRLMKLFNISHMRELEVCIAELL